MEKVIKKQASRRKYHFIYKTTCIITNKFYIGMHSTDNLEDGYVGSGKRLWYSINKHGKDNHVCEIFEFLESRELLKEREREIVNEELLNNTECMNLVIGGEGSWDIMNKNSELQSSKGIRGNIKMKELREFDLDWKNKCSINMSKGQRLAYEEGRKQYGVFYDWTGKTHSEESKRKIGEANSVKQKGSNNSQFGKCWITNEIESKKIMKGDSIPDGWKLGRKM